MSLSNKPTTNCCGGTSFTVRWDKTWFHSVVVLLYQPLMIDDYVWGGGGSSRRNDNWQRKENLWRKPAPLPLCAPRNELYENRDRKRIPAVGRRRVTAGSMARLMVKAATVIFPSQSVFSCYLTTFFQLHTTVGEEISILERKQCINRTHVMIAGVLLRRTFEEYGGTW
jgi:hypothetical protein